MTIIEMQVHMDCEGCQSKIRKVLQKLKGVDGVDIDMPTQKVTVTGWTDQKKVLKTVRRTGRRAEIWPFAYNPDINNNTYAVVHSHNQHQYCGPSTYYAAQPAGSSYNYYKHGGNGYGRSYYPTHSTFFGNRNGDAFSDENPHGCSIM